MLRGVLLVCMSTMASALSVHVQPAAARAAAVHARPAALRVAPLVLAQSVAEERIEYMVKNSKVLLFMKGNKLFPQCGFSNTAVRILESLTPDFETFDVLSDEGIREGIKQYSNWPTIPQCYVDGEFIGGADILIEMYENGELAELVERAAAE